MTFFQSTGSHRLTVCTSTDSCYYFPVYTWGQKRNSFPQGSSGPIFKIPKNVISYEPTEPAFEWAKFFWDILRFFTNLSVHECTLRCSMKIFYVKEYFLNGWKLWHTWWQRPFNVYLLMRVLQMKQSDLSRLPPKYLRVVHKCRLHSFCYQAI